MARPPLYKTVGELQSAIDSYFKECAGRVLKDDDESIITDKHGQPVIVGMKPPTITGLAVFLGFSSRQALLNYQGRKQFNDTITRAKLQVEEYTEMRLFDKDGARGAEFSLKNNFGWKDKQEIAHELDNGFRVDIRVVE